MSTIRLMIASLTFLAFSGFANDAPPQANTAPTPTAGSEVKKEELASGGAATAANDPKKKKEEKKKAADKK